MDLRNLSEAARNYLETESFQNYVCETCWFIQSTEGYFDPLSGFVDPPSDTCPCEYDIFDSGCAMRHRLGEIVGFLEDADKVWRRS